MKLKKIKDKNDFKNYYIVCNNKKQSLKCFKFLSKLGFRIKIYDNDSNCIYYCSCGMIFENLYGLELTLNQNNMPFIFYSDFIKKSLKFRKLIKE